MQKWIDWLYLFLLNAKGQRTFRTEGYDNEPEDTLDIVVIRNGKEHRVKIYFRIVQYAYIYKPKLFRKHSKMYLVSSDCSKDTPEVLKHFLTSSYLIPRLAPWYVSEDTHKKILTHAFIDLVTEQCRNITCTHSPGLFPVNH